MKKIILIFLLYSLQGNAQLTFGVKISGLAFHPQKELNEACYRWKIDKKGKFVGFVDVQ